MTAQPEHYTQASRTVLKYASAMVIVSMLSGISFQESAKKLPAAAVREGLGLDSVLRLALLHGHVMVATVLVPIAMLGALYLARAAGGRVLEPWKVKVLTRGYLPFVTLTVMLMLYKGYHVLLSVRRGQMDLLQIDASYFGGVTALRHIVYGISHVGMGVSLGIFAVVLWRGLAPPHRAGDDAGNEGSASAQQSD